METITNRIIDAVENNDQVSLRITADNEFDAYTAACGWIANRPETPSYVLTVTRLGGGQWLVVVAEHGDDWNDNWNSATDR